MITLYHVSDAWGLDPSPFCLKVETYFRLAKIPFEKAASFAAFLKAPRKKLPYIVDDGEIIADSETIIEHLKKKYDVWLDDWLTPEQRAISHTVRRMLEDGTYWVAIFERWIEPTVWTAYKPVVLSAIPKSLRNAAGIIIRRDYKRRCYGQGISRYSRAEIKHIAEQDIEAVATILAEKTYFLGNRPASVDAVVFGFLGNWYYAPLETETKKIIASHPNLTAYLDRIRDLLVGPARSSMQTSFPA
jgi:glutathione S-transferase